MGSRPGCRSENAPKPLPRRAEGAWDLGLGTWGNSLKPQASSRLIRAGTARIKQELKRVEEKFVRTAVVMVLVVHGQSIKTTAEHPFFVPAQGKFVAAGELQVGEHLVGHDGKLVQIESIGSTGEVTTVYNLRVADFHTYFVGGGLWGFDVWVHNASYQPHVGTRTYCFEVDSLGRTRRAEGLLANPSDARIAKARNPAAQQRLSQGTGYHAGHLIGDQFG